jgi:3-oxoadipate enol-lactonase
MPYFATQDGCRLFYETQGFESERPILVFLNGTMQNTLYWRPQCVAFGKQFRILMYDARAQGQSDLGEQELSLEGHAADLEGLLDHLGVQKAHLVGLSHGAKVALAYAAGNPERVDRLVLCSVGEAATCRSKLVVRSWLETLRGPGLEAMVWASLPVVFGEGFLKEKERILPSIVNATVKRNRQEALIAHLEAMGAYSRFSQIAGRVHVPILVISGSEDPLVTEEGAEKLASLCRGRHEHLVGVGHSIPIEAPELFDKIVLQFLDKT